MPSNLITCTLPLACSRSHSVFTCIVERNDARDRGKNCIQTITSHLNLIDLAGEGRAGSAEAPCLLYDAAPIQLSAWVTVQCTLPGDVPD